MMHCSRCGKELPKDASFCAYCGSSVNNEQQGEEKKNDLCYHLPINQKRECDIKVYSSQIIFEGKFWYLKEKEFYRNKQRKDIAFIKDFLGIGYLKKRSPRACFAFIISGTILGLMNSVIKKVTGWADDVNSYLQWIGESVSLPGWVDTALNITAVICLLIGIFFFFSKKNVVEISFTNKRICVPQKSISSAEYAKLYQVIKTLKN